MARAQRHRRALIVGIDNYKENALDGCVNDAKKLTELLERNEDGSKNFHCKTILAGADDATAPELRKQIEYLFANEADFALFHFSGHGGIDQEGGFLVTTDTKGADDWILMSEVIDLANKSPVDEVLIILDCCHSGEFGNVVDSKEFVHLSVRNIVQLSEGVSVLTAARDSQFAMEDEDEVAGVFTLLLASGLSGGAADILGQVTVAGLYSYVDQALGPWQQRPLFKAHLSRISAATTKTAGKALSTSDNGMYLDQSFPEPNACHSAE